MPELSYRVSSGQVQVEVTPRLRGPYDCELEIQGRRAPRPRSADQADQTVGAARREVDAGRSVILREQVDGEQVAYTISERIGLNVCQSHFPTDPPAAPPASAARVLGRWELPYPSRPGAGLAATAQLNQVGPYVYGWLQVEARTAPDRHAPGVLYAGRVWLIELWGKLEGRRARVTARAESTDGRRQTDRHATLELREADWLVFSTDAIGAGEERGFDLNLQPASSQAAAFRLPRLPDEALWGDDTPRPLTDRLFQAEARPLRAEQVRALREFVSTDVSTRLARALAARDGSEIDLFVYLRNVLTPQTAGGMRCLRLPRREEGCPCRGGNVRACGCAALIVEDQLALARWFTLVALDQCTLTLDGTRRTVLQGLYLLAEGTGIGGGEEFTRFRELFGEGALPRHLHLYRYVFDLAYVQGSRTVAGAEHEGRLGPFKLSVGGGLALGARGISLDVRRYVQLDGAWVKEAPRERGQRDTLHGVLLLVKLSLEFEAEFTDGLPIELGVEHFMLETHLLWGLNDFPGMIKIFSAGHTLSLPLGLGGPGVEGKAIVFSGTGHLPPLIGEMDDVDEAMPEIVSTTGVSTSITAALETGAAMLMGYLFRTGARPHDDPTRRLSPPPPSRRRSPRFGAVAHFEFDQPALTPAGTDELGVELARCQVLLRSPHTHLRIEGHTSRRGSWFHNQVLSMRRAQAVLQTIVDICGDDLGARLTATPNGDAGTTRLFGEGERRAALAGEEDPRDSDRDEGALDPDTGERAGDDPNDRVVEVGMNGEVVLTLRAPNQAAS